MRKPEWLMAAALLAFLFTVCFSVAMTGGMDSPLVYWIVFTLVGIGARFGRRGVTAGSGLAVGGLTVAVLIGGAGHLETQVPKLAVLLAAGLLASRYTRLLTHVEHEHREAARRDPLTGLQNRAALDAHFEALSAPSGDTVALVLCDLDHFKSVNDDHGHQRGDDVLRDVASVLRTSTARGFELAYRVGGEEFLLVLPGTGLDEAEALAQDIRRALVDACPAGLGVTASFGVSCGPAGELDFTALYESADKALYEAKAAGRNRVLAARG